MKRAYIIAEAGVNHEGDFETAYRMVEEAARSGCDAIKFQSYDPERLVTAVAPAYWDGDDTQQAAYKRVPPLTHDEFSTLSQKAHDLGLDFIVTPFHVEDVEFFAGICDRLKVASGDITNRPLIEAIEATELPALLSTGASTDDEITDALRFFNGRVTLLHCILSYPTEPGRANLQRITKRRLDGYSDHTIPPASHAVIQAAYTLGATVIEKHFTLDKTLPGNDHYHSFAPHDFRQLRENLDLLSEALEYRGEVQECEQAARVGARRSWTSVVDIPAGTTITAEMVTLMRPGTGLQP